MNKKIDRRKKYILVMDTEACPIDRSFEGVEPNNMLVYDIGFAVVDKKGNVYETFSFVVDEIFYGEIEKMNNAYYAKKLPRYYSDIESGERVVDSLSAIKFIMKDIAGTYNIDTVSFHNARFDVLALNNTCRWLGWESPYFLPYPWEVWDTLSMSKVITSQKSYIRFCEKNGYMTNHKEPRPRATAEILNRYISGNNEFIESHTGLEDVLIEKDILAKCLAQHKPMKKVWGRPKK